VAVELVADDTVVAVELVVWLLSVLELYQSVDIQLTVEMECHKAQQTATTARAQRQLVNFMVLQSILFKLTAAAVAALTQTIEQGILVLQAVVQAI
jgi:hypothetical protein